MSGRSLTWLGVAAVVAILAATALTTIAAVRDADRGARDDRREATAAAAAVLRDQVDDAAETADDVRAFLESSDEVTAADFARFTSGELTRDPSLARVAWTEGDPAAPTETLAAGREAGGPEVLLEPAVREAAAAARDAAQPRMSAPLESGGVVVVAPVYAAGTSPTTPEARRAALRGFVTATLERDALAQAARDALPADARLQVTDGGTRLLGAAVGAPAAVGLIEAAGRDWRIAVAGVGDASPAVPAAVAVAGVLLAAVVALLFAEAIGRERSARGELALLRVRHDVILSAAGDGIVSTDGEGVAGFANPAAARMLGRPPAEIVGARVQELGLPWPRAALRAGDPESGEVEVRRPDGTHVVLELTTTPVPGGDPAAGVVVTFRDVTARKRTEARTLESLAAAEEMAAVDSLTGLANHRTFHERLAAEVSRAARRGAAMSLVLMDLDHFKRVNDQHGHQTGDRVLARAAQVLREQARSGELLARVGGEEFALILPDADTEEARRAAERMRRAVAATPFPVVGSMTISAGVCDLERADDAASLYRLADDALYQAKHRGRDRVVAHATGDAAATAREQADRRERQQTLISVRLLARVVDAKHPATRGHSERVGDLCAELAEELGWSAERAALLREAGLVHDVGKIGVPDEVLLADGPLDEAGSRLMREHPSLSARIAGDALTQEQVSWVRGHHERWDGTGYPHGLLAEDCPEGARILALADAWDSMTTGRHDVNLTPDAALAEVRANAGTQFWPPAVEALLRLHRGA